MTLFEWLIYFFLIITFSDTLSFASQWDVIVYLQADIICHF